MSTLTDFAENLVARVVTGRQPALPTAVFLALGTGGSEATGTTGEPAGNGYARQRVTFTGTGPQQNADTVRFTFTGAAGTFTHCGLFDAVAGGNALTWGALPLAAPVTGPGTLSINPGSLTVTAD